MKEKNVNEEEAINKIAYGFEIQMVGEDGTVRPFMFFVSHNNNLNLLYVQKDTKNINKLEISRITQIQFGNQTGNFKKLSPESLSKYSKDLCLTIIINVRSFDLIFYKLEDIKEFSFGMSSLWDEFISQGQQE